MSKNPTQLKNDLIKEISGARSTTRVPPGFNSVPISLEAEDIDLDDDGIQEEPAEDDEEEGDEEDEMQEDLDEVSTCDQSFVFLFVYSFALRLALGRRRR